MRLDDSGEVIEMSAEELASQYGSAVRPEELEEQVEGPVHRQDRHRRDTLIATLDVVDAPANGAPAGDGETPQRTPERTEGEGEKPARRRRRGRRGGRGRRRSGGGGGQGGSGGGGQN